MTILLSLISFFLIYIFPSFVPTDETLNSKSKQSENNKSVRIDPCTQLGTWSSWSECPEHCGVLAVQTRTRSASAYPDLCRVLTEHRRSCPTHPCGTACGDVSDVSITCPKSCRSTADLPQSFSGSVYGQQSTSGGGLCLGLTQTGACGDSELGLCAPESVIYGGATGRVVLDDSVSIMQSSVVSLMQSTASHSVTATSLPYLFPFEAAPVWSALVPRKNRYVWLELTVNPEDHFFGSPPAYDPGNPGLFPSLEHVWQALTRDLNVLTTDTPFGADIVALLPSASNSLHVVLSFEGAAHSTTFEGWKVRGGAVGGGVSGVEVPSDVDLDELGLKLTLEKLEGIERGLNALNGVLQTTTTRHDSIMQMGHMRTLMQTTSVSRLGLDIQTAIEPHRGSWVRTVVAHVLPVHDELLVGDTAVSNATRLAASVIEGVREFHQNFASPSSAWTGAGQPSLLLDDRQAIPFYPMVGDASCSMIMQDAPLPFRPTEADALERGWMRYVAVGEGGDVDTVHDRMRACSSACVSDASCTCFDITLTGKCRLFSTPVSQLTRTTGSFAGVRRDTDGSCTPTSPPAVSPAPLSNSESPTPLMEALACNSTCGWGHMQVHLDIPEVSNANDPAANWVRDMQNNISSRLQWWESALHPEWEQWLLNYVPRPVTWGNLKCPHQKLVIPCRHSGTSKSEFQDLCGLQKDSLASTCQDDSAPSPWSSCSPCGYPSPRVASPTETAYKGLWLGFQSPAAPSGTEPFTQYRSRADVFGDLGRGKVEFRKVEETLGVDACTETKYCMQACGAVDVAVGKEHTCVVTDIGQVECYGANSHGQLGPGRSRGDTSGSRMRVASRLLPTFAGGAFGGLASQEVSLGGVWLTTKDILKGRSAQGWGGVNVDMPHAVVAGVRHTCVVMVKGGARCWGDNSKFQLGLATDMDMTDTVANVVMPVNLQFAVHIGGGMKSVAAGANHTCAVTTQATVLCWGDNERLQLGSPLVRRTSNSAANEIFMQGARRSDTHVIYGIVASGDATCVAFTTETFNPFVRCWGMLPWALDGDGPVDGQVINMLHEARPVFGDVEWELAGFGFEGGEICMYLLIEPLLIEGSHPLRGGGSSGGEGVSALRRVCYGRPIITLDVNEGGIRLPGTAIAWWEHPVMFDVWIMHPLLVASLHAVHVDGKYQTADVWEHTLVKKVVKYIEAAIGSGANTHCELRKFALHESPTETSCITPRLSTITAWFATHVLPSLLSLTPPTSPTSPARSALESHFEDLFSSLPYPSYPPEWTFPLAPPFVPAWASAHIQTILKSVFSGETISPFENYTDATKTPYGNSVLNVSPPVVVGVEEGKDLWTPLRHSLYSSKAQWGDMGELSRASLLSSTDRYILVAAANETANEFVERNYIQNDLPSQLSFRGGLVTAGATMSETASHATCWVMQGDVESNTVSWGASLGGAERLSSEWKVFEEGESVVVKAGTKVVASASGVVLWEEVSTGVDWKVTCARSHSAGFRSLALESSGGHSCVIVWPALPSVDVRLPSKDNTHQSPKVRTIMRVPASASPTSTDSVAAFSSGMTYATDAPSFKGFYSYPTGGKVLCRGANGAGQLAKPTAEDWVGGWVSMATAEWAFGG